MTLTGLFDPRQTLKIMNVNNSCCFDGCVRVHGAVQWALPIEYGPMVFEGGRSTYAYAQGQANEKFDSCASRSGSLQNKKPILFARILLLSQFNFHNF